MKRIVLKFGGTSVADASGRQAVADIIQKTKREYEEQIVVVSAMGRQGAPYATDTLLEMFGKGRELPQNREQDMIYACGEIISGSVLSQELRERGISNVFLTGAQAGIETDAHFSDANIVTIHTEKITDWLKRGYVVIVAGGQGVAANGDITAIGRGGSDTTACAIGYYVQADAVHIYTDVDGIYTGDPRLIPRAKKIPYMAYGQCRKLAEYGAKVIHPNAVSYSELGHKNVLSVRSTFVKGTGTSIGDYDACWNGITGLRNLLVFATPHKEDDNLARTLERHHIKPRFICADGAHIHYGIDTEWAGMENIPTGQILDVIFIVGPGVTVGKIQEMFGKKIGHDIYQLSDDSVAVAVAPEQYEPLLNELHDGICLYQSVTALEKTHLAEGRMIE